MHFAYKSACYKEKIETSSDDGNVKPEWSDATEIASLEIGDDKFVIFDEQDDNFLICCRVTRSFPVYVGKVKY